MIVTSGLRSMKQHLAIYSAKGITDQSKIPMKSRHLIGAAVDIYDPDGSLMAWIKSNVVLLEQIGLWVEDDPSEPRVHLQIMPPFSGSRFFKP